MERLILVSLAGLLFVPALAMAAKDRPIPQDPEKQQRRFRDMLAWNRRTLEGAYDKVGRKDPRWDRPAREAMRAAAHVFSSAPDVGASPAGVYNAAKQALDAGCDDPLVLYLYARTSTPAGHAGPQEADRRYTAAAVAMQRSAYPPFRRFSALKMAGITKATREGATPEEREEAVRQLDAALDLLSRSVAEDEHNLDTENLWYELPRAAIAVRQKRGEGHKAAYDEVDAILAKSPSLEVIRLQVRGDFFINYAWEARGNGYADTVTEEGWRQFRERLTEARAALERAWALKPGDLRAAVLMLRVEKGIGGDRAEMEKWFERAMRADGNCRDACLDKLDWLDPKWHGSREELLAFGRACRDSKNWQMQIPLLLGDAHYRVARQLSEDERREYLGTEEVWRDIKGVYDEYLEHVPGDKGVRSQYAGLCYMCGKYPEAYAQFQAVGGNPIGSTIFPEDWLKQVRASVNSKMRSRPSSRPSAEKPGRP
jgi:hypothetical protein